MQRAIPDADGVPVLTYLAALERLSFGLVPAVMHVTRHTTHVSRQAHTSHAHSLK
jgi:hypothetical protein